ncbi:MAG: general secretion pathway protein GspF, partial [Bacteroidetes bacterium RIFOXYC12_FULL_35_7]
MSIDIKNIKKTKKKEKAKPAGKSVLDFMNRDIALFGSGLSDKTKERLYSDLHILLSSGIDIKTALELIVEDQKKKKDKILFDTVSKKVIGGNSLSDALQDTGKITAYEYFSLKIGEESGKINEVLLELAAFFTRKIKQKRQLVNAFSYPVLVLLTAITAVTFMMKFVVPMFKDVFARFQGKLPYITELIIQISEWFSSYFWYAFLCFAGMLFLLYSQKKKLWFRKIFSSLLMRLPLAGPIVKKVYIVRFCQAMALLIGSRTPMLKAIQLVKNMIRFYP